MADRKALWAPSFSKEIEGWARKHIARNKWRVEPLYDEDDLYQDAFIIFMWVKQTYPKVVEAPHFMRLFQVTYKNHLHDLANERSRLSRVAVVDDDGAARNITEVSPDNRPADIPFDKMPEQVRLLWDSCDRPYRPRTCKRYRNGRRMTTNEFLCTIAGLDPATTDLRSQLETFIGNFC